MEGTSQGLKLTLNVESEESMPGALSGNGATVMFMFKFKQ